MSEGRRRAKLKKLSTQWAKRTVSAGRVAATLGGTAVRQAVLGTDGGTAAGELLAARMDELKGILMKVGQMFSYMEGVLSPEAMEALRTLQSSSRSFEFEEIRALVEGAFQTPLAELFESFEEEPFAAASIGQVHRALYGGRPVAVKVQYPGILDTLRMDLDNADRVGLLAGLGTSVDPQEILAELRERFEEECDYAQEAASTIAFARAFADEPRVRVVDVVPERSRGTILTTGIETGRSLYDVAKDTQEERNRTGDTLFEVVCRSIFHHCAFNGDPHPGNYLFQPEGRVVLLDFGCVRYLGGDFVDRWKTLARSVLDDDRRAFPEAFRAVGMVGSPKFDFDAQWDLMKDLYRPFAVPRFKFEGTYIRDTLERMKFKNPNVRYTSMPGPWVLANRLLFGTYSLLHILGAEADWGRIIRHWIDAPTAPIPKPPRLVAA